MDNKKNSIILTVIAVATLLVAMVGATFAYFTASGGGNTSSPVTVTTKTSTSTVVGNFDPIVINATPENFYKDGPNLVGDTKGEIVTSVGEGSGQVETCYTVKLEVKSNDMEYTTAEKTPELLFTATKNGTEVIKDTDITTLGTTETTLQIPVTKGSTDYIHKLTATTGTQKDEWTASVTLVNLPENQEATIGNKVFLATFKLDTVECQ